MQNTNTTNKRELQSPENTENEQRMKVKRTADMEAISAAITSMESRIMTSIQALQSLQSETNDKISSLLTRIEKTEKALEEATVYMKELSARLDIRDQMDLVDCFRLTGLPAVESPKEDQFAVIEKTFKLVGCTVKKDDLTYWAMYPNRQKTNAVIVGKFCNSKKREEAFRLFKQKSKIEPMLFGSICEPHDPNDRLRVIRLRSSLTKPTMNLLNMARQHIPATFEFVWEREGRIFVRKAAGERAVQIKSEAQLMTLVTRAGSGSTAA